MSLLSSREAVASDSTCEVPSTANATRKLVAWSPGVGGPRRYRFLKCDT